MKSDLALFQFIFDPSKVEKRDKLREIKLEQWADPNSTISLNRDEILSWAQLCAYEANSANNWEAARKQGRKSIHLAHAASRARGYPDAKENLKKARAVSAAKNYEGQRKSVSIGRGIKLRNVEIARNRIVESIPEFLPPQGLRCKNLVKEIRNAFHICEPKARLCIYLAVERRLIYRVASHISGFKPGIYFFRTRKDLKHAVRTGCMPVGEPPPRRSFPHRRPRHDSVLTEKDIPEIFRLHAAGLSQVKLANRYGVNRKTIAKVLHRETWVHVKL
jgi:hypothetical protein